jgi:cytochrome P450
MARSRTSTSIHDQPSSSFSIPTNNSPQLCNYFSFPLRHIPGPWYTNITRLPLKLSIITGQRMYYIDRLHKQYGPMVRISPTEVSVSSPAAYKEIHRINTPFVKSAWYEKFTQSSTLTMFAMRDPKVHAQRRKVFARPFSKSEMRRNWEKGIAGMARLAVRRIKGECEGEKGRADVYKWWTFLATDVSAHVNFGESFHMLELGKVSFQSWVSSDWGFQGLPILT